MVEKTDMIFAQLSWICAKAGKKRDETRKRSISQLPRLLHAVEGLIHIPISRSTHLMPSIAIESRREGGKIVGSSGQAAAKRSFQYSVGNSDAKAVMSSPCCKARS